VLAQLVKAVKRLVADVAGERVEVRVVVVQSGLSLVHAKYVAIWNKAVIAYCSIDTKYQAVSSYIIGRK
jgi:hypothetical protein